MSAQASSSQWLPLAGALAAFWTDFEGFEGPTASHTKQKLGQVGVSYKDLVGTRSDRVLAAVENADASSVQDVVTELVDLIRERGFFERDTPGTHKRMKALQSAISKVGGLLDEGGALTWHSSIAHGTTPPLASSQIAAVTAAGPASPPLQGNESAETTGPTVDWLLKLLRRIPYASFSLTKDRRAGKNVVTINDEYDAQDFMHMTLKLLYADVRAEEYTPSYAGSSSRTDFHIKREKVVVEAKVAHAKHDHKKVADELNIDIVRYSQILPTPTDLICVVYDLDGTIKNREGFENDFTKVWNGVKVHVVVELWPFTQRTT